MIKINSCKTQDEFPEVIVYYNNRNIGTLESEFQFTLFKIKLIQETDEEISKYSIKVIGSDVTFEQINKNYKFSKYANLTENPLLLYEWGRRQDKACEELLTLEKNKIFSI